MAKKTIQLGALPVTSGEDTITRMAVLLWGPAGDGKTTFAATAPGDKLWLSFGDNEHVSIAKRKDVHVVHLYTLGLNELFNQAQSDNPFGLDQFLSQHTNIETVVIDSLTALTFRALQRAIEKKIGAGKGFTPTTEAPGIAAYGGRNGIVLECLTGLLRVTAKHNVHIIITAHEADPTMSKDERGNDITEYIGVQLGGQLVNNVTWRLSEIWYLSQSDKGARPRRLAIRRTRLRQPMKTRLFRNGGEPEFELHYDATKPDSAKGQMTISNWYDQWIERKGDRLNIPRST